MEALDGMLDFNMKKRGIARREVVEECGEGRPEVVSLDAGARQRLVFHEVGQNPTDLQACSLDTFRHASPVMPPFGHSG